MHFGNEIMQGTNGYRLPATDHRIVLRRGSTILWSVAGSPVISLKLSVIALTHWLSFDRGIMNDSSPDALKDLKQFAKMKNFGVRFALVQCVLGINIFGDA